MSRLSALYFDGTTCSCARALCPQRHVCVCPTLSSTKKNFRSRVPGFTIWDTTMDLDPQGGTGVFVYLYSGSCVRSFFVAISKHRTSASRKYGIKDYLYSTR